MQREVEEQCTSGSCRFPFYAYIDVCIASNPLVRLLVQVRARIVFKSRLHDTASRLKLSPSQTYCKAGAPTLLAVDWLRGVPSSCPPLFPPLPVCPPFLLAAACPSFPLADAPVLPLYCATIPIPSAVSSCPSAPPDLPGTRFFVLPSNLTH